MTARKLTCSAPTSCDTCGRRVRILWTFSAVPAERKTAHDPARGRDEGEPVYQCQVCFEGPDGGPFD